MKPPIEGAAVVATENAVELAGVGRTFPGSPPTHALRPTDLAIAAGDFVSISGPSGSGKSTLLAILGLLDSPTEGSYRLAGIDTVHLRDRDRTAMRGQLIGFVFQSFHLLAYRSAVENVAMANLYQRRRRLDRERDARDALRRVGLGHRLGATPATMSGGERQRVAVARAIINRPALLLCDEPTGNLDSRNTDHVLALLDDLNATDGLTVVVVTHDREVAARARRHLMITDGETTEVDAAEALATTGAHR